MTEGEAMYKICPIRRVPEKINDGGYIPMCSGSACMMWRWEIEMVQDAGCDVRTNEDGINEFVSRPELSQTNGYCGLAGKTGVA